MLRLTAALGAALLLGGAQDDVRDLPLVEVTPPANMIDKDSTLVVMLSGDGDWASIDQSIAMALTHDGAAVVGVKMRSYLTSAKRTPDGTAHDVERIVHHYLPLWHRSRLILVGYSRGADALPFVLTRLTPDVRARVALGAMLGAEASANFHFRWVDVVSDKAHPDDLPVAPELARLRGTRLLCIFGHDETNSACRDADPSLVERVERPGSHHFDNDFPALAALVWQAAKH